jgi:hypothetical protein
VTGAAGQRVSAPIELLSDLKLSKAAYVPEPHPLASDYEVGALYFPGCRRSRRGAHLAGRAERKPCSVVRRGESEVVDWQIKWAVENGLSYFLVDWYWSKGDQHHDHWSRPSSRRYKSYLKWAVMWANHNGAGSHSRPTSVR